MKKKLTDRQKLLLIKHISGMIFLSILYGFLGYEALKIGGVIC